VLGDLLLHQALGQRGKHVDETRAGAAAMLGVDVATLRRTLRYCK
jgi:hypothetical protein